MKQENGEIEASHGWFGTVLIFDIMERKRIGNTQESRNDEIHGLSGALLYTYARARKMVSGGASCTEQGAYKRPINHHSERSVQSVLV